MLIHGNRKDSAIRWMGDLGDGHSQVACLRDIRIRDARQQGVHIQ